MIYTSRQSLLHGLNLQRQQPRIVPAERQIPAHEPESRMSTASPNRPHLSFFVEAPDIPNAVRDFLPERDARLRAHVLVSCREDDFVRAEFRPVREAQAAGQDLGDLLALFDFDLAVCDHLARANVDVVSTAALEVFEQETGVVGAAVDLEAGFFQAFVDRGVVFTSELCYFGLLLFEQRRREAPHE